MAFTLYFWNQCSNKTRKKTIFVLLSLFKKQSKMLFQKGIVTLITLQQFCLTFLLLRKSKRKFIMLHGTVGRQRQLQWKSHNYCKYIKLLFLAIAMTHWTCISLYYLLSYTLYIYVFASFFLSQDPWH